MASVFLLKHDKAKLHPLAQTTGSLLFSTVGMLLVLPFFAQSMPRAMPGWVTLTALAYSVVIGVAVVGKFGAASIAARITGNTWKDSLTIGALMNTRGLMELVVLNIGYDLGVLNAELFAIMVLMAPFIFNRTRN